MDINGIFNDFAKAFEKKIDRDYKIRLQLEISDMEDGILRISNEKFNIEAKNYYNITPKDTVYIENNVDECLEIIYLSA